MAQKIEAIKGYPEWLPEQRLAELHVLDAIRARFELWGFTSLETRAVERLEHLVSQGETEKEIYLLRRLQAADDEAAKEGGKALGLHFDLTVPLARYVVQNQSALTFPFRRYQIQKVWRGERPQEGRFREFYQADADVIVQGELPLSYDAEILLLLWDVVSSLPIPPMVLHINNRKVLEGAYRALGVEDVTGTLRVVDKLDKIGEAGVGQQLRDALKVPEAAVEKILALGRMKGGREVIAQIRALGLEHEILERGLGELGAVLDAARDLPEGAVVADLHIARGFDYYTGTVYEGVMRGYESVGSVCSGGRYDNLASFGTNAKFPGTGVSIGVSRILSRLFADGRVTASRKTPTCVLVALNDEESRGSAMSVARTLRARGVATEVFDRAAKFGKQIKYASDKGIPFVWFPSSSAHEVRDVRSGEQKAADPATWMPPDDDRRVKIQSA